MIIAYGIFGGFLALMLVLGAMAVSADHWSNGFGLMVAAGWAGVIGAVGMAGTALVHLLMWAL